MGAKTVIKNLVDDLKNILAEKNLDDSLIARGISIIENFDEDPDTLRAILNQPVYEKSIKIGITGAPGVGKSTFINSFIQLLNTEEMRTAIIAVDPSSRKNKGAILGDRIRLSSHLDSGNLFFRSMANHGLYGGLTKNIAEVIKFLEICGFKLILIESVGVGQNEVEIQEVAEIIILLLDSNIGDGVQIEKSGIMEIGHILFINKADRGLNENFISSLRALLGYESNSRNMDRKIVPGSAIDSSGVLNVIKCIEVITKMNLPLKRD
jgi:LAO/AO transport system kinase